MSKSPIDFLESGTFVMSPSLQVIMSRTIALHSRGGLGVWHGGMGLGKTTTALHLLNAIDNGHLAETSDQCKALYYQVGYGWGQGVLEFKRALKCLYEGA